MKTLGLCAQKGGAGKTTIAIHMAVIAEALGISVAIVDTSSFVKLDEVPLHDPSPASTRDGRRLLYDAIDTSGHGDAACRAHRRQPRFVSPIGP